MMRRNWLWAYVITVAALTGHAHAQTLWQLNDSHIDLAQHDLTFSDAQQLNSAYGLLAADASQVLAASGGAVTDGYINLYRDDGAGSGQWVVRNMPIGLNMGGFSGLSTMFDLGNVEGEDVSNLTAQAVLSDQPLLAFPTDAFTSELLNVGDVENNAQGAGGNPANPAGDGSPRPAPPSAPIDATVIQFNPTGLTSRLFQPFRQNIEQDTNQCMPAAVANSLQWLEDTYDIDVPHDHEPGIRDDSLVGQLDQAMNRQAGQYTQSAQDYIDGKVNYLDDADLDDDLIVKHKERNGINWLNNQETSDDGNVTSNEDDSDRSLIDWILDELAEGEDVEVRIGWDGGGGHMIDLIGGGRTFGVPWLAWVHDAKQGADGGTGLFDGGHGWSPIVDNKIVAYIGGQFLSGTIDFATSESIPEPSSLILLSLTASSLLLRRRPRSNA